MFAKIYTKNDCPYCVKAKKIFLEHDIDYSELTYTVDFTKEELAAKMPEARRSKVTFPQIWIDGTYVGGCDDLEDYLDI